jgi:hypothetical protein
VVGAVVAWFVSALSLALVTVILVLFLAGELTAA